MSLTHQIAQNVEDISRVEAQDRSRLSWSDRLADVMTAFSGSMRFVLLHGIWFLVWILVNTGLGGLPTFDTFPYGLLTMIVSLEAIFLSTFVLISENRQEQQSQRRAKVDLQFNMIAEQEVTKLIEMVAEIQRHLGVTASDAVTDKLQEPTRIEDVAAAIEAAERDAEYVPPG